MTAGGVRIAASILAADVAHLGDAVRAAERAGIDLLHIDVMDGQFVPPITMGALVVDALRRVSRLPLDVHLMVREPERQLEAFAGAGATSIAVHLEAVVHPHRVLTQLRSLGVQAGIALNPGTPPDACEWLADVLDFVLVMTVDPGYAGQAFQPAVLPKIARIRRLVGDRCWIAVDGGISPATAPQAVAAGANITFKILYNSAVAMTGGQDAAGAMPVPELTRALEAEGVRRILVLTDEPDKYPREARWARGVEVWHRDRLDEAQRLLREVPGVTALIYDQRCAAEKRRLRKRGRLPEPAMRVYINEAVCEGCGDCGVKSNCLSVQPVDTEFGRKTQIHQSSCNRDYSCLLGDCPSFVTVLPLGARRAKERRSFVVDRPLPEPVLRVPREASVFMTGIGGTGVVTVNQILGTAALLDGRHVRGLDQTGLSQKGGPVVSHLKLFERRADVSNKVGAGEADCYLGFDILVATSPQNLDHARPEKTIAVVSTSRVPTGAMVASTDVQFPDPSGLRASIDRVTRKDENVYLDALALAEALFDDHMAANLILLGAAYQAGAIPVSAAAIEEAIALNGVAVGMNTQAFRAGRLAVADPAWVRSVRPRRVGAVEAAPALTAEARALV
ncbi:MAG: ribulose-phosphate 3-epimerase, partial [Firmicutes bacterium]|nr:ribulose-phosphate 3-epimerase [Bacillota bacterium]